jgi:hypothetical protein
MNQPLRLSPAGCRSASANTGFCRKGERRGGGTGIPASCRIPPCIHPDSWFPRSRGGGEGGRRRAAELEQLRALHQRLGEEEATTGWSGCSRKRGGGDAKVGRRWPRPPSSIVMKPRRRSAAPLRGALACRRPPQKPTDTSPTTARAKKWSSARSDRCDLLDASGPDAPLLCSPPLSSAEICTGEDLRGDASPPRHGRRPSSTPAPAPDRRRGGSLRDLRWGGSRGSE